MNTTSDTPSASCASAATTVRLDHVLDLDTLDVSTIRALLWRARSLQAVALGNEPPGDVLAGKTIATAFFEPSTRTRLSFTLAAERLGARVIDLAAAASSLSKGESILDTARTLVAMGVDAIVMRTQQAGAPHMVSRCLDCAIINAGDGQHAHPTQSLLDIAALASATERFDSLDLSYLHIAIVGDIAHSRVVRSAIAGMTALGAHITLVGPPSLVPAAMTALARSPGTVTIEYTIDAVLDRADVIMCLRIQFERAGSGKAGLIASVAQYRQLYALTTQRAAAMKAQSWIMHPGPANAGLEIDSQLLVGPRSLISSQVSWGLAVRAAVLEACA